MSIVSIIQELPPDLQPSMLKLMEAIDREMREKYAVRREDFDALRATVQELAEAQRRTEERLDRLALRVEELAEAQRRTEQRVSRLEEVITALTEAQQRTELRLGELAERMERLVQTMERFQINQAKNTGWRLEQSYREKAYAYFGRVLRRVRVVPFQEIEDEIEELPPADRDEILLVDLIVRGRPRHLTDFDQIYLAVEVSAVVDRYDVGWALKRADVLRSLGYVVVPVVAGEDVTRGAEASAREDHVALFQNGTHQFWDEALQRALAQARR